MKNVKVAFFDARPYDRKSFDSANKDFGVEIKYFNGHLTSDTAVLADGFNAICAFVNDIITKDVIDVLAKNNIQLIALRSAGYNNVDFKAAYKRIHVVRVPAYSPYAVAEHAMALMLALNRKLHKAYYRTRDSNFNIDGLLGFDMHGKTMGVIGAGKIGKILIGIAKGFGMKVLAYDISRDEECAKRMGFEYADLDRIYGESDIISLHNPLTKETRHMINKKAIGKMKDGVILVNTGRGKLIDTRALIGALKAGKVGAAGLDVYEEEGEYFFEDFSGSFVSDDVLARLLTFNNVLITSHQGFFTKEALENIAQTTLSNIKDYFKNKPLMNEICYKCNRQTCRKKSAGRCF